MPSPIVAYNVRADAPGFPVTGVGNSSEVREYHATNGQLIKVTRSGYAATLFNYDDFGSAIQSGLDLNQDDSIATGPNDRISESTSIVELYNGAWWTKTTTKAYAASGAFTTSVARQRLTGLPAGRVAESSVIDAEGNTTGTIQEIARSTKTVTTTTTRSGVGGTSSQIDVNGYTTSATGHDALTTTQAYDSLGRPTQTTDSRSNVTTTAYYAGTNRVSSVTDAAGNLVSRYGYDTSGRVAWSQDAANCVTYFEYNQRGQLLRQWGSGTYPTQYGYDSVYGDRTTMSTYRAGTGWSGSTWPTATTGTADTTTWVFDGASGLLWKKIDAAGKAVEYTYNIRGQVATRDWARLVTTGPSTGQRVRTTYTYDPQTGELLGQSYNDGTPGVTYAYTRLGQVYSVTDGTGSWDYVYDATRPWRLGAATLPAIYGTRVYTPLYESTGVVGREKGFQVGSTAGNAADFEVAYAYTSAGRLDTLAAKRTNNTVVRTFQYGYEPDAALVNALSISGSHPFTITRTYDPDRNLLTSIESKWSTTSRARFDYTYDARSQRSSKKQSGDAFADYGNSTYSRFAYNDRGEVIQSADYLGSDVTATTNPLPGRFHEYAYDPIGNRTSANRTGVPSLAEDYTTNALNQYTTKENNAIPVQGTVDSASTSVTVSGGSANAGKAGCYWGDEVTVPNTSGPWTGSVSLYATKPNAGGDYIKSGSRTAQIAKALQAFTYDADGNPISDGMWDYGFDAENRLIRMETTATARTFGIAHRVLDFKYDFKGRRVQKRVLNGVGMTEISSRRYLYNGWNVIAEWNAPGGNTLGSLVRSYAWGLDLTGSFNAAGGVGALLQITDHASSKTYLPMYDGNGNVTGLLDGSTGSLAAAYEYDPYGNLLRNEVIDAALADQPFKFSTKWTDAETQLIYYGYRFYNPSLGRFMSRDSIEETGGRNLYGFCGNDGANGYDYLGMVEPGSDPMLTVNFAGHIYNVTQSESALMAPGLAAQFNSNRDGGTPVPGLGTMGSMMFTWDPTADGLQMALMFQNMDYQSARAAAYAATHPKPSTAPVNNSQQSQPSEMAPKGSWVDS